MTSYHINSIGRDVCKVTKSDSIKLTNPKARSPQTEYYQLGTETNKPPSAVFAKQESMDRKILLTQEALRSLRQVRRNSKQISRKEQKLRETNARIADEEARIKDVVREHKDVESDRELQEAQGRIEELGLKLKRLDALKAKLANDLSGHDIDLSDARQHLEEEICSGLQGAGQLTDVDDTSDVDSDPGEAVADDDNRSLDQYQEHLVEESSLGSGNPGLSAHDNDSARCRTQKAMSLLGAAREDLQNATRDFRDLERMCQAQRQDFDAGVVPEWRDLTSTEFDLEQLAQNMDFTKKLIKAQRAYSEAGRHAVEVGFVREDSNQSCHFLDDSDDGACSGDTYAIPVPNKGKRDFVEAWLGVTPPYSTEAEPGERDAWEVDSIKFGESCSVHGEGWYRIRIDRFEELRGMERERFSGVGIVAYPDELLIPVCDRQRLLPATPFPVQESARIDVSRAGLWKASSAFLKDVLVSGRAASAKLSVRWLARRDNGGIIRARNR